MIPMIYEMQDACVLADVGTVFPVSLGMEHPAQIIPIRGERPILRFRLL